MKEKNTVFIKIQGSAGTGKTAIAIKLARVLEQLGIKTEVWEFDNSYQNDFTDEEIDKNLKTLSSKIKVIIQTEQIKQHLV